MRRAGPAHLTSGMLAPEKHEVFWALSALKLRQTGGKRRRAGRAPQPQSLAPLTSSPATSLKEVWRRHANSGCIAAGDPSSTRTASDCKLFRAFAKACGA